MITLIQQGSVCDLESSEPGCQEDGNGLLRLSVKTTVKYLPEVNHIFPVMMNFQIENFQAGLLSVFVHSLHLSYAGDIPNPPKNYISYISYYKTHCKDFLQLNINH